MKIFRIVLICFLFLAVNVTADRIRMFYRVGSLTGGGASALDGITEASIEHGDIAIIRMQYGIYYYEFNENSPWSESEPRIIVPDDRVDSTGAWRLLRALPYVGYFQGLGYYAASTTTVTVSAGACTNNESTDMMWMNNRTKNITLPYTSGIGGGALLSRTTFERGEWYNICLFHNESDDVTDWGLSSFGDCADIPSGARNWRWIGAIRTEDDSDQVMMFGPVGGGQRTRMCFDSYAPMQYPGVDGVIENAADVWTTIWPLGWDLNAGKVMWWRPVVQSHGVSSVDVRFAFGTYPSELVGGIPEEPEIGAVSMVVAGATSLIAAGEVNELGNSYGAMPPDLIPMGYSLANEIMIGSDDGAFVGVKCVGMWR